MGLDRKPSQSPNRLRSVAPPALVLFDWSVANGEAVTRRKLIAFGSTGVTCNGISAGRSTSISVYCRPQPNLEKCGSSFSTRAGTGSVKCSSTARMRIQSR